MIAGGRAAAGSQAPLPVAQDACGRNARGESAMAGLISCIVPVFNGAAFLEETLASVLAQDHDPIEVIVVDDGSVDGSPDLAARRSSVRVVRQATRGPSAARNRGIKEARGDFLAFLDQDDLWHPEKLSRQMARLRSRPEVLVCWSHAQLFWVDAVADEGRRYAGHRRGGVVPGYATTTMLARREAFARVGQLDESFWFADAPEWALRARHAGVVMEMMDEVLTYHRVHGANLTRRRSPDSRAEFLRLTKLALDLRRSRLA
jgi:glycosyltransferase involved in cell wall biosynthesis